MKNLHVNSCSASNWCDIKLWQQYLYAIAELFGANLTYLDEKDSSSRKAKSIEESAEFICAFGPREESRWLFGSFNSLPFQFTIHHFRSNVKRINEVIWTVPQSYLADKEALEKVCRLFDIGNKYLSTFYGYCDYTDAFRINKQVRGPVNLEVELSGIFWLTYFGKPYVDFFGASKLFQLPVEQQNRGDGIMLRLGERPEDVDNLLRTSVRQSLGKDSFATDEPPWRKSRGQYVLTIEQIANSVSK